MPNEVYNYVRISGANEELKNQFLTLTFVPESYFQEPQPNGRDDSVLLEWRRTRFGSERLSIISVWGTIDAIISD